MQLPSPGSEPIRLLLADDHQSFLWGLQRLVESASPPMRIVARALSQREVRAALAGQPIDVVLLDHDLGGTDGLKLLPEILAAGRGRVVILTGSSDTGLPARAMRGGAAGFVHKSQPAEVIIEAITRVHAGGMYCDPATSSRLLATVYRDRGAADSSADALTAREREVLAAVARHGGTPYKVVAAELHVSLHTLRNHLASIYDKLRIHNRVDLFAYANRLKPQARPSGEER